jgi:multidrug efflux system membrane fusion protein
MLGRALVALLALAMIAIVAVTINAQSQQRRDAGAAAPDIAVPVLSAQAHLANVPVYLEGVGTVRALNTVTVRALVDGTLLDVNFQEGQDVKQGEVLARIEPTIYEAQLDQQLAKKAVDEAQLVNAKKDLDRYSRLMTTNAVAIQQLDAQKALVSQLEAQIKLDEAMIKSAKASLDYCTIVAPIAGRTGLRQVDRGNVVHVVDATGIVVITQIEPIAVVFSLPQRHLGRIEKALAKGELKVEAVDPDEDSVLDMGRLTVINNQIDQTTGTVQIKAQFPNTARQLWPGQYINVRLLIDTLMQAVVVPTAALQLGPKGAFVYVVQPDMTVAVRPVGVTQRNAAQSVIAQGLQPSEQVVTSGFAQLADRQRVIVSTEARSDEIKPDQNIDSDPTEELRGVDRRDAARPLDGGGRPTTPAPPRAAQ